VNTVISARMINEFRWQYAFEDRPRLNNGEGADFVSKVGPQVQVTGCCFFGGVSFLPIQQNDSRLQFADNFSLIGGGHNFKFGFDFNRSHVAQTFRGNWRGVYIFNNTTNFVNNLNSPSTNAADQFRIFFGAGAFDVAQKEIAAFAQDSWKIHPRLTLTAGLRWEAALYPQPINPNPLLPQTSNIPNETREWQPRLGLSWDVFGNARTVFRTSAGIFYARTPMLLLNQAFNANGSPLVGVSFTLSKAQILQARTVHPEFVFPFVPDASSAANASFFTAAGITGLKPDASFFDPDFHNPRSFNASAGIEHLLMTNLSISLEWLHTNTVHLERIRDVNLTPPTPGAGPDGRPLYGASRVNANFGILRDQESAARANYDSMTLSLNRRGKRLQFLTAYTLAYSRDNDSNERNFAGIAYEDAFNLAQEYRWSREDIRHRASLSAVYDLPLGFQVSTLTTWRTGIPFSAFTGVDSNNDRQFTDKPIINGVHLPRNSFRRGNFFNIDFRASKTCTKTTNWC
jgi:TonB dependent receptor